MDSMNGDGGAKGTMVTDRTLVPDRETAEIADATSYQRLAGIVSGEPNGSMSSVMALQRALNSTGLLR